MRVKCNDMVNVKNFKLEYKNWESRCHSMEISVSDRWCPERLSNEVLRKSLRVRVGVSLLKLTWGRDIRMNV